MMQNKSKSELIELFETNNKDMSKIIKCYIDDKIDSLLAFFALIVFVTSLCFVFLIFKTEHQKTTNNTKFDLSGYKLVYIEQRGEKLCTGYRKLGTIEQYYTYCSKNKNIGK